MTPLASHPSSRGPGRPVVVLVHGLWMPGWELGLLARRLHQAGFATHIFSYHSLGEHPERSAERLREFIAGLGSERLHLVGHSLGGLVIRLLLAGGPALQPGRVVTLGTPHSGSYVAAHMPSALRGPLLGKSAEVLAGEGLPPWPGGWALGSLAGSLSVGLGWFVRGLPRPNDGTVAVAETRLAGMADHRVVRASHMGLLLSARAAAQTAYFLHHGRFAPE